MMHRFRRRVRHWPSDASGPACAITWKSCVIIGLICVCAAVFLFTRGAGTCNHMRNFIFMLPDTTCRCHSMYYLSPSFQTCVQGSGDRVHLSPLLSLGNAITPQQDAPSGKGQPPGDSLLRCSSNPVWWSPGQLAFVGPDGCLQIVQLPSGAQVMKVDSHYFLPGSRVVASQGLSGEPRRIYVLSALIQAARYAFQRPLWSCCSPVC